MAEKIYKCSATPPSATLLHAWCNDHNKNVVKQFIPPHGDDELHCCVVTVDGRNFSARAMTSRRAEKKACNLVLKAFQISRSRKQRFKQKPPKKAKVPTTRLGQLTLNNALHKQDRFTKRRAKKGSNTKTQSLTAVELGKDPNLAQILNNVLETKRVEVETQTDWCGLSEPRSLT